MLKVFENFVSTLGGGGMSSYFPGGTLRKKSLSSLGDGEELINSQPTQPRYRYHTPFSFCNCFGHRWKNTTGLLIRGEVPYRLNIELDLHFLGSMGTAVVIGWDPATPLPLHLGANTRALLVSQDRRHLFVTPWALLCSPAITWLQFIVRPIWLPQKTVQSV